MGNRITSEDVLVTKKEFKEAMMRGLGRCILELDQTENVEKYREIVMWGCTHNLSYDTQCEGTRAWYMRELIRRFPDEKPFVDAVIQKLSRYRSNTGWEFSYYCELLGLFVQEGNRQALTALKGKYEELYEILKNRRRLRKNGMFPEYDDFETLCIVLLDNAPEPLAFYIKVAREIGTLMLKDSALCQGSFAWLFDYSESTYGKSRVRRLLAKEARLSEAVSRYFYNMLRWNEKVPEEKHNQTAPQTTEEILKAFDEEYRRDQESDGIVRLWGLRIGTWIKRAGNKEVPAILAQRYLTEQNLQERTRLLGVFGRMCPFPLSPELLIHDAQTGDEMLKEAAFCALRSVRHERIRLFALELAEKGEHISETVSLLANHYQKEDREVFAGLVKSIPVTYDDKEDWHGAHSSVISLLKTKGVKAAPKELLPYLYEHTLCSCCREYIVKEMGRRRMMTETVLQECLYDSNYEIRRYAERRLNI